MGEKVDVKVVCYIKFQYNKMLRRFIKNKKIKKDVMENCGASRDFSFIYIDDNNNNNNNKIKN